MRSFAVALIVVCGSATSVSAQQNGVKLVFPEPRSDFFRHLQESAANYTEGERRAVLDAYDRLLAQNQSPAREQTLREQRTRFEVEEKVSGADEEPLRTVVRAYKNAMRKFVRMQKSAADKLRQEGRTEDAKEAEKFCEGAEKDALLAFYPVVERAEEGAVWKGVARSKQTNFPNTVFEVKRPCTVTVLSSTGDDVVVKIESDGMVSQARLHADGVKILSGSHADGDPRGKPVSIDTFNGYVQIKYYHGVQPATLLLVND